METPEDTSKLLNDILAKHEKQKALYEKQIKLLEEAVDFYKFLSQDLLEALQISFSNGATKELYDKVKVLFDSADSHKFKESLEVYKDMDGKGEK